MPPITTSDENDKSSSSTNYLKDRRFKLSRACDRCRRRRIKCDEGHPCQACQTSNSECTFEETGKRSHPHKSKKTANLEERLNQMETLLASIPPSVFATYSGQDPPDQALVNSLYQSRPFTQTAAILPPVVTNAPLTNPAGIFADPHGLAMRGPTRSMSQASSVDQLIEETARLSLSPSFHYRDDQGYTRWQGETSGLPLLSMLIERHADPARWPRERSTREALDTTGPTEEYAIQTLPRATTVKPDTIWKTITAVIDPELMDDLVKCFLSTSYYLLPFLHLPSFMEDYGSAEKWREPGFGAFIVAVCCLSSRHIDDPRVQREESDDGAAAGEEWFELFGRLRTLPGADRPTLYTIQAVFIAAVYAVGQGKLSRALTLLAEAVTLATDAGVHRSVASYDEFDAVEEEVRKRTFWCVYLWDKQSSAHFGRPPLLRLRDCDISEPAMVDDEYIKREGVGAQPEGVESRMSAFVCTIRLFVVLEAVLDTPPTRLFSSDEPSHAFLNRATAMISGHKRNRELRDEEALLDEVVRSIPPHWAHTPETMSSEDVVRVTQAERLHCFEQFVRLLIYRHRFSELVAERLETGEHVQSEAEIEAIRSAHSSSLKIVAAHLNIATRGLMTYYGVHVIHQLTAAGRSLVSMFLNCHSEELQPLVPSTLEAMRSCCGLLKRFSSRYTCGLRASDMMTEFCRLTQIPLEVAERGQNEDSGRESRRTRGAWMRPLRKKRDGSIVRSSSSGQSPRAQVDTPPELFIDPSMSIPRSVATNGGMGMPPPPVGMGHQGVNLPSPPGMGMGQAGLGLAPMSSPSIPPPVALHQPQFGYRGGPHAMNGGQSLGLPTLDGTAYGFNSTGVDMRGLGTLDTTPDIAAYLAFLNGGTDQSLGLGPTNGYGVGDPSNPQMYDPRLVNGATGL